MGSRTPQAVREEIAQIRSGLDEKLTELEKRLPPMFKLAKRAALAAAGGTGSGALFFAWRKVRSRRESRERRQAQTAPVVQVLPRGAVPAAVLVAAVWAGVRLYEARIRSDAGRAGGAVVRSLRERSA